MKRYLLIILASFMPFAVMAESLQLTVTSKTTVKVDGDLPEGCEVTYIQTGGTRAGQVTADNYNSVRISNMPQVWIRKITLMMHSNSASGAGIIELYVDDVDIYANRAGSFADSDWAGAYTTSDVPITLNFYPPLMIEHGVLFEIAVSAFVNSLYVSSYLIEYSYTAPQPCVVNFNTHTDVELPPLTEQEVGSGVVLPSLKAPQDWYFAGWSEMAIDVSDYIPHLFKPGTRYITMEDITLHAVYTNSDYAEQFVQDTTLTSGDYMLADVLYKCVATNPHGAHLHTEKVNIDNNNEDSLFVVSSFDEAPDSTIYEVVFNEYKALIKHKLTNRWVGYPVSSKKELTADSVWWNVEKIKYGQVNFYHIYSNGSRRELRAEYGERIDLIDSLWFVASSSTSKKSGTALIRVLRPEGRIFTSYPLGSSICDSKISDMEILNGTIYNHSHKQIVLYNISGQIIYSTTNSISLSGLPPGIYLLRTPNEVIKFQLKE